MAMQEVAKSNEYSGEAVKEVSREDVKDVEDFKNYYEQASEEEKKKLNYEFSVNLQQEISKDPDLQTAIEWENSIDSEITESDINDINDLNALQNSLNAYPNLPRANRQAIDRMIYSPFRSSEWEIKNIVDKAEEPKDGKVEEPKDGKSEEPKDGGIVQLTQ